MKAKVSELEVEVQEGVLGRLRKYLTSVVHIFSGNKSILVRFKY